MRILVVTPEFPPHTGGGILRYYALLARAWAAAGAEVTVLVASPFSEFPNEVVDGVRVVFTTLEHVQRHADRLSHLAAAPMFRRWIAAGLAAADIVQERVDHYDVIEVTDFGLLFAPILAMTSRPPVVVAFHGSVGQIAEREPTTPANQLGGALARVTEASLVPYADDWYAYSPMNAAEWTTLLSRSVRFLPPPFDVSAYADAPKSDDAPAVVVGRIQTWKGPEVLCQALAAMASDVPADLTIDWIGRDTPSAPNGGSLDGLLRETYPDIWGTRIRTRGPLSLADVVRAQASARFVIVPSVWDTFNYTLTESMAAATVTVGSQGAGASFLIEDGANGFSVPAGDAPALADAIRRAHALTAAERRSMGLAARETVVRRLAPADAAERSFAMFEAVQRAPRRDRPSRWLSEFVDSAAGATDGGHPGYLANVSIRDLSSHLKDRLVGRVLGRAR
jgi:glycosyltransferase involved in cell wall biosynthesis